jgi:hypothetical protein
LTRILQLSFAHSQRGSSRYLRFRYTRASARFPSGASSREVLSSKFLSEIGTSGELGPVDFVACGSGLRGPRRPSNQPPHSTVAHACINKSNHSFAQGFTRGGLPPRADAARRRLREALVRDDGVPSRPASAQECVDGELAGWPEHVVEPTRSVF